VKEMHEAEVLFFSGKFVAEFQSKSQWQKGYFISKSDKKIPNVEK